jgi:RluA family pseudouridine synthase
MDLPILYEDEHLLIVDKPPRLLVVQAPGRSGPTVLDVLQARLGAPVHAVHRLDEDTTGVLVLARTKPAAVALEAMFKNHEIERIYLAVVTRQPTPPAGCIESLLREDASGVVKSVVKGPGQRAVTHYRTLKRVGKYLLVECRPETGRRNQIRVHLAELGCPIVGDRKYGYRQRGRSDPKGLLLHAHRMRMFHPFTGVEVIVRADVPEGFPAP